MTLAFIFEDYEDLARKTFFSVEVLVKVHQCAKTFMIDRFPEQSDGCVRLIDFAADSNLALYNVTM